MLAGALGSLLLICLVLAVYVTQRGKRGLRLPDPDLPKTPIAQFYVPPEMLKQQEKEKRKLAEGKRSWSPKPGCVWNPLLEYPRNARCVCGSGKKFKSCCLPSPHFERAIPADRAVRLKRLVELAHKGHDVPALLEKARADLAKGRSGFQESSGSSAVRALGPESREVAGSIPAQTSNVEGEPDAQVQAQAH